MTLATKHINECKKQTLASQKNRSVWQSEVYLTLILTSLACGGATSTRSITKGFPASHATAATKKNVSKVIKKQRVFQKLRRPHNPTKKKDISIKKHILKKKQRKLQRKTVEKTQRNKKKLLNKK